MTYANVRNISIMLNSMSYLWVLI